MRILLAVRESIVWIHKLLFEWQLQSYTERIRLSVPLFWLCSFTHRIWLCWILSFFYLSSLLQMPNSCGMVDTEFLGNFSCSWKRIRFDDALSWSLSTSSGWPLCFSSSRLSSPLQNFLNHHRTVWLLAVSWPNALLMLPVVSTVLQPILNLNKKVAWICF